MSQIIAGYSNESLAIYIAMSHILQIDIPKILTYCVVQSPDFLKFNFSKKKKNDGYHEFPDLGMGQNLVPLVNPKIAGKWMFIPLKMYL
jgi:hypothetical protein